MLKQRSRSINKTPHAHDNKNNKHCLNTPSRRNTSHKSVVPHKLPNKSNSRHFSTKGKSSLTKSTSVDHHTPISESPHGVLARDFIRESLYSKSGYFNSSRVINSPGVINFSQLLGRSAYEKRLSELYYSGIQGWTTPVEIFQPFYAQSLSRYFLSHIIRSINQNSLVDTKALGIHQKRHKDFDINTINEDDSNKPAVFTIDGMDSNEISPLVKAAVETARKEKKLTQSTSSGSSGSGNGISSSVLSQDTTIKRNIAPHPSDEVAQHKHILPGLPKYLDGRYRHYGVERNIQDLDHGINTISNISIMEIGAGNGTAASNILDYIQSYYPNVYKKLHYNIIEMSETLSHRQRELLDPNHAGKYSVNTINAAEYKPKNVNIYKSNIEIATDNIITSQYDHNNDDNTPENDQQIAVIAVTLSPTSSSASSSSPVVAASPHKSNPSSASAVRAKLEQQQKEQKQKEKDEKQKITNNIQSNNSGTITSYSNNNHTFIFGLEVLDNMPHDKVIQGKDGNWYQIMVATKEFAHEIQSIAQHTPHKMYKIGYNYSTNHDNSHNNKNKGRHAQATPVDENDENDNNNNDTTSSNKQNIKNKKQHTSNEDNPTLIDAITLSKYINQQELPIYYEQLNIDTQYMPYIEYPVPILDPTIKECLEYYLSHTKEISTNKHDNNKNNNKSSMFSLKKYFDDEEPHTNLNQYKDNIAGLREKSPGLVKLALKSIFQRKFKVHPGIVYLPTESLRFLHVIDKYFPQHTLLLADFDKLPSTEALPAVNGPVVAHKSTDYTQRGQTQDEPSYLVQLGLCDIFFPTDFNLLSHMYRKVVLKEVADKPYTTMRSGMEIPIHRTVTPLIPLSTDNDYNKPVNTNDYKQILSKPVEFRDVSTVISHYDFLWRYGDISKTQCRNGFNPMLDDYLNMAIFVGQRKGPMM